MDVAIDDRDRFRLSFDWSGHTCGQGNASSRGQESSVIERAHAHQL
jgi:hypothetical protein